MQGMWFGLREDRIIVGGELGAMVYMVWKSAGAYLNQVGK